MVDDPDLARVYGEVVRSPGVWIAALCRKMHGLEGSKETVLYCGRCAEYANPRKRSRAAKYKTMPTLFGPPPYQLHPPCSEQGLTWLRHRVYRLEKLKLVARVVSRIPDNRQARGWDWGSRLYPIQK